MRLDLANENNPNWKGSKVGYQGIHAWLKRHLGKANKCIKCKTKIAKRYEWANISQKYKRDFNDWKQLCSVCRRSFDNITKLSKEDGELIKQKYFRGESRNKIASEFKIHRNTIYNIIKGISKYYAN